MRSTSTTPAIPGWSLAGLPFDPAPLVGLAAHLGLAQLPAADADPEITETGRAWLAQRDVIDWQRSERSAARQVRRVDRRRGIVRAAAHLASALVLFTSVAGCSVLGVLGASSCDPDKEDACPEGQRCAQSTSGSYYCFDDATLQESSSSGSGNGGWRIKSVTVTAGTGGVNAGVTVENKEGGQ